ncbi:HAD hydrolase-like protein [Rhodothermus profundi]|uniref:phosphoglycolate phosphatase n=1 Tax=Rhodothermus profundi TaxID=633813 RepID=A0A1M6SQ51_9BACT|nr:HAD hydrolase-like protein [Rhodothermus profundi]SHK46861.1 Phosphoglycolate phosphatase, HAD superfamily [Rhodothermus profundi]
MHLLLFDIDGTLIRTRGFGRQTMEAALSEWLGRPVTTKGVDFAGRTDPAILLDILKASGLPEHMARYLLPEALEVYSRAMLQRLRPDHLEVLPGVIMLLEELSEWPDVYLGLVTGNLRPVAFHKLALAGLAGYFGEGAYGCDHANRNELPPLAIARAREATGYPFTGAHAIIIGDTPHDIICARHAGAAVAAVCTGSYPREALAACQPDLLLDDLSDPEPFLEWLSMQRTLSGKAS